MLKQTVRGLIFSLAMALATGPTAGQAYAQKGGTPSLCEGVFETRDTWEIRYDPFAPSSNSLNVGINLVNNGGAACPGQIIATSVGNIRHLSNGNSEVPFQLKVVQSGKEITPGPPSYNQSSTDVTVPPGDVRLQTVHFSVIPGSTLSAGRYSQNVYIEFVSRNGRGMFTPKMVTLVFEVASSAIVGLKGEFTRVGDVPTINLGELEQGIKSLRTEVYVHSTAGYSMTVSSENGGELRSDTLGWSIDYGLRLGTHDVDLRAPYVIPVASAEARRDDYPLVFSIGNVDGKRAGRYSDTLRFTVTAM